MDCTHITSKHMYAPGTEGVVCKTVMVYVVKGVGAGNKIEHVNSASCDDKMTAAQITCVIIRLCTYVTAEHLILMNFVSEMYKNNCSA